MNLEDIFLKEYEENIDAVFRFCYFKVSDKELAKDLTHEAWGKAWTYLASGREIENIKAFVFKTARNLIIDQYRKQKTFSLEKMMEDGFSPSFDERSVVEDRADIENAFKVIDELPEESREIILMRHLEGFSVKEIAEVVGDNSNNISVKIHRIIKEIKKSYKYD